MAQSIHNPLTSGQAPNLFTSGGMDFLQSSGKLLEFGYGIKYRAYQQMQNLVGMEKLWTSDPYGKFKVKRETTSYRTVEVKSRTAEGINLRVFFTDTNFKGHRIHERVYDQLSGAEGRIIERGAGFMLVEPSDLSVGFASTAFAVGNKATMAGVLAELFASKGTEKVHKNYTDEEYLCGIFREGNPESRRDKTEIRWVHDADGKPLWSYRTTQRDCYELLMEAKCHVFWTGAGEISETQDGNWKAVPLGIDKAIANKGGTVGLFNNFTKSQFEGWISDCASITGGAGSSITIVAPTAVHGKISDMYSDFTKFGGKQNTYGVENGIDIYSWEQSGIRVKLMGSSWHDNTYLHKQQSNLPDFKGTIAGNTMYIMNNALTQDLTSGTATSRLQEILWRSPDWDNSTKPYIAKVVPGMINSYGNHNTGVGVGAMETSVTTTASDVDGDNYQMIYDGGMFIDAEGWFKIAPAQ